MWYRKRYMVLCLVKGYMIYMYIHIYIYAPFLLLFRMKIVWRIICFASRRIYIYIYIYIYIRHIRRETKKIIRHTGFILHHRGDGAFSCFYGRQIWLLFVIRVEWYSSTLSAQWPLKEVCGIHITGPCNAAGLLLSTRINFNPSMDK